MHTRAPKMQSPDVCIHGTAAHHSVYGVICLRAGARRVWRLSLFFRIVALCCCRSSHMKEVGNDLSDSAASVCILQNTYTMPFLTWKSRFRRGRWGLRERPSRRHLQLRHTLHHYHGGSKRGENLELLICCCCCCCFCCWWNKELGFDVDDVVVVVVAVVVATNDTEC